MLIGTFIRRRLGGGLFRMSIELRDQLTDGGIFVERLRG